jgi:hypothetical protein
LFILRFYPGAKDEIKSKMNCLNKASKDFYRTYVKPNKLFTQPLKTIRKLEGYDYKGLLKDPESQRKQIIYV